MSRQEPLRCHYCHEGVGFELINQPGWVRCGNCGKKGAYWVFPAYYRAEVEGQTARTRVEAEASCFFHPEKAALVACDVCGRFLCTVCDIQLGKDHLCTICLQSGKSHPRAHDLENERVRHDSITLMLALLTPVAFWPAVVFTAPYALYRAIRYFNYENSVVDRTKWRLIVAMLLSTGEMVGSAIIIYLVVKAV